MQCNCRKDLEQKLADMFREKLPDGYQDFDAKLSGYTFLMVDGGLDEGVYLEFTGEVQVPKKTSGMKRQKIKHNVLANYCPFCGKRAAAEKGEVSTNG